MYPKKGRYNYPHIVSKGYISSQITHLMQSSVFFIESNNEKNGKILFLRRYLVRNFKIFVNVLNIMSM